MSRTYRFLKVKQPLSELNLSAFWVYNDWNSTPKNAQINPFSQQGKAVIARIFSDAKHGVMRFKGPGWFHNQFSQRPYRRKAKTELKKFMNTYKNYSSADWEYLETGNWSWCDENDDFHSFDVDSCAYHEVLIESKPFRQYWY